MSRHSLIFGLFCIGIVMVSVFWIRDGYSPFATGGARGPMFFGGSGPNHK